MPRKCRDAFLLFAPSCRDAKTSLTIPLLFSNPLLKCRLNAVERKLDKNGWWIRAANKEKAK